MAKNTTSYKDLSVEDLQEKIANESLKLQQLKMNHSVSVLENPMQIRHTRKEIAKMKTELQARKNQA